MARRLVQRYHARVALEAKRPIETALGARVPRSHQQAMRRPMQSAWHKAGTAHCSQRWHRTESKGMRLSRRSFCGIERPMLDTRFSRCRRGLARNRPNPGPEDDRRWPGFGRLPPSLGRHRPDLARRRPMCWRGTAARNRPHIRGPVSAKVGPPRAGERCWLRNAYSATQHAEAERSSATQWSSWAHAPPPVAWSASILKLHG